jgi:hypothetical protein
MFFRLVFANLTLLILAGCISRPAPGYRRVDSDAPEFKAAVAREAAVEASRGKSASEAENIAIRRVTAETVDLEKQRRTDRVLPLIAALEALDRPRGCWAYTRTTTRQAPEKTTVEVERFDPFQPEERIWTLLSRDGRTPTEDEQASYRHSRLRKWKSQQAKAADKKPIPERITRDALRSDHIDVTQAEAGGPATFSLVQEGYHAALLGTFPRTRQTYTIDEAAARVQRHTRTYLAPAVFLAGSVAVETWDQTTDYVVIESALAPFPVRSNVRLRLRGLGHDTGDLVIETVYSDYRRVKCYDDRFEVQIGVPSVQDYLPGGGR